MSLRGCSWPGARGFSLLEVLVALTIFGLSAGTLMNIFGTGIKGTQRAHDRRQLSLVAESVLNDVGAGLPLTPGTMEAVTAGRFAWRLFIEPYAETQWPELANLEWYRVQVDVWDQQSAQSAAYSLQSLRMKE